MPGYSPAPTRLQFYFRNFNSEQFVIRPTRLTVREHSVCGFREDSKVLAQPSLRDPGCLGHEVILFRDTRCSSGCNSVVFDGAFIVADHFEQMGADRVETIVTGKPTVVIERP